MAMEQLRRAVQRARRDDEQAEGTIDIQQTEGSAEVVEDAECCLTDIDAALEENACCLTEVAEATESKTWRDMTDDEIIEKGDLTLGEFLTEFAEAQGYENYSRMYEADSKLYDQAYAEAREYRDRFDQAYQQVTGMTNHRDCGCGC